MRTFGEIGASGSPSGRAFQINSKSSLIDLIACAAHMANWAYCQSIGEKQVVWEELPEWHRDSIRSGVTTFLKNPQSTPHMMHIAWLDQKRREGWIWGPIKDPSKKCHPCLLPYEELPAEQRQKDANFLTTVQSVARALGVL